MIVLTNLRGEKEAINDELIERIEAGPQQAMVHLTSGVNYIFRESVAEIIRLCQLNQAEVHVIARHLYNQTRHVNTGADPGWPSPRPDGDLLPFGRRPGASGHATPPG